MQAALAGSRAPIIRYYKRATYCYFTPIGLVLLSFLWNFLLLLALLTLLPCASLGLYFTSKGFALARKHGDLEKKDVGYANMLLGIIMFGVGLLGAGFAYLSVS